MVIDTHVLVWYAEDNPQLNSAVRDSLSYHRERVVVPSILLWELMLLVEKGRIDAIGKSPDEYARGLVARSGFREEPLTSKMVILSRTLKFLHEDPADRFIASTAVALDLPLVTYDQKLIQLPWLKTIS